MAPRLRPRHDRLGFTLIELLACGFVTSILIALMLPAVQAARETARRMQCRDRLRQLTLATHAFHDAHQALPPLEIADSWATWAVLILPEVEQSHLSGQWNLNQRYYVQPRSSGADLPIFHCPSRPAVADASNGTAARFLEGTLTGPPGWSDFGACAGTSLRRDNGALVRAIDTSTGLTSTQAGSGRNELGRLRHPGWKMTLGLRHHALDGLTNTILFGEMHIPPGARLDSVFNGDTPAGFSRLLGHDGTWNSQTQRFSLESRLVVDPNYAGPNWSQQFGSAHRGVCHFSLADGSVRAIGVSMDFEALDRIARRGDGQPVSWE